MRIFNSASLRKRKQAIFRESGFRYRGDGIAAFGDFSLPIYTDTGVCSPEKLFVTDAPRMYRWREHKPDAAKLDTIALLSFSDGSYNASECYRGVLKTAVHLSLSPDARKQKFIVKCKST